jgi:putative transcriptional regulator
MRARAMPWVAAVVIVLCACGFAAPAHAQPPLVVPSLLVATPELDDPVFAQSVILLLPGGEPPLMAGVIINQPTTIPISALLPDAPERLGDVTAYFGGPVEMNAPVVLARANTAPAGATAVAGDLYWIGDRASVAAFVKGNPAPDMTRVYYGRAQWLPLQLRGEIQNGAWYVEPTDASAVFSADPKQLWRTLVERGQLEEAGLRGRRGRNAVGATFVKLVR